jgi:hypothetical protein
MNAVGFSYSPTCAVSRLGVAEVSKARIEQATKQRQYLTNFVGDLLRAELPLDYGRKKHLVCDLILLK